MTQSTKSIWLDKEFFGDFYKLFISTLTAFLVFQRSNWRFESSFNVLGSNLTGCIFFFFFFLMGMFSFFLLLCLSFLMLICWINKIHHWKANEIWSLFWKNEMNRPNPTCVDSGRKHNLICGHQVRIRSVQYFFSFSFLLLICWICTICHWKANEIWSLF